MKEFGEAVTVLAKAGADVIHQLIAAPRCVGFLIVGIVVGMVAYRFVRGWMTKG